MTVNNDKMRGIWYLKYIILYTYMARVVGRYDF
jgi:hypothetical protein